MALEDQLYDFVYAYEAAFERAAHPAGLSGPQACLLVQLRRESRTMGELAVELVCDASNVSQMVARLESRCLVVRQPDPDDRRTRRVSITEAGVEVIRDIEGRFSLPSEGVARLTEAECEQLSTLLAKAFGPSRVDADPVGG
ncbi:DNA-binding MarR family transcriptional regulator [Actinopolyspora lacussalsi]|nr:DNA-binding MarR family transcriptional regulator [Actinopolyspora lacussalsi]